MSKKEAVILIGHGGVPTDAPRDKIAELKRLEAARQARGELRMSEREAELDTEIRNWPRTAESDPYKAGLEAVASRLRKRLAPRRLAIAYNEFCAPSVEQAVADLAAEGFQRILLVTTMFTPGGSHSDRELPKLLELLRHDHPGVQIDYLWPFDLDQVADFLLRHIDRAAG